MPTPHDDPYAESRRLDERARRVIPGGAHLSGRPLLDTHTSPLYFERAKGCRITDVDGREYVDFVMAYGPYLLGYADESVDAAACRQASRGSVVSLNHALHVRFAEELVRRFAPAEMAMFFKTGSEATTAAMRIARRATGRRLIARAGYHGWHDWCLPRESFVPQGLDEQVLEYDARAPSSLATLLSQHESEFAAVILAPEMITPMDRAALHGIAALARAHRAVFVLDEVKTGLRIPPGSIQRRYDVKPDLTTLSKALGNGWPVAAVVGSREVMSHAAGLHVSATYHGDTIGMAAALRTLALVDERDAAAHAWRLGERLIEGLNRASREASISAVAYGEPLPPMPFLRFTHTEPDVAARQSRAFYAHAYRRGVLFHPRHLWFVSRAHEEADIAFALDVAREAFDNAHRAASG